MESKKHKISQFTGSKIYILTSLYQLYILYIYRGDKVQIIISNSSDKPIYEQIVDDFKDKILSGELASGEMLPSIRSLAKDLKISVITTKRAYEELEKDGFIETIRGKGCFVKTKSNSLLQEEILKKVEDHLSSAVSIAIKYGIDQTQIEEIIAYLYEEGEQNAK